MKVEEWKHEHNFSFPSTLGLLSLRQWCVGLSSSSRLYFQQISLTSASHENACHAVEADKRKFSITYPVSVQREQDSSCGVTTLSRWTVEPLRWEVLVPMSRGLFILSPSLRLITEDPVKSMETIAHSVRLQGSALVSYRLRAAHGWPGNQPFRV
jgi:hypothetical protein